MRQQFVEVAERPDPHTFVKKPASAFADRIAGRFAQQVFVGGGSGGRRQHDQRRAPHQDQAWPHSLPHADGPSGPVQRLQ